MVNDKNGNNNQSTKGIIKKSTSDGDETNASENKSLTFKDWKSLKESQSKTIKDAQNRKSNGRDGIAIRNEEDEGRDIRINKNSGYNNSRGRNCQVAPNFFVRNIGMPGFMLPNNFNGLNNFNNLGVRRNNSLPINKFNGNNNFGLNNFNNSNNFYRNNGIYKHFNFPNNNYTGPSNSFHLPSKNFIISNSLNGASKGILKHRDKFINQNSGDNVDLPDSFFASDGIYRQKDLMQKPLPKHIPEEHKPKQLSNISNLSYCNKYEKKKNKINKQSAGNDVIIPEDTKRLCTEPKIYIPNPKVSKDGKPYIPKPKLPQENLQISKEEKKKQWKEYREAMKPFKNREFYNAKRVVQRLGKKDIAELDEKEQFRLNNAREIMAAHKARLTAKYSNYIKTDHNSNELGEVYILKKKTLKDWEIGKEVPKEFENYGNFGELHYSSNFEPGRKILGGYSSLKVFTPGDVVDVVS